MPAEITPRTDARLVAARTLWQRNQPGQAASILQELHAQEPAREDVAMFLAEVLRSAGRLDGAARTLLEACRAGGFANDACLRAARFARQCDRHAVAAEICDGVLAGGTASTEMLVTAGHVARETGDFDAARARYLEALDAGVDLEHNHVLGALAHTRRYVADDDPDILRFEQHFRDRGFSPRSRASAGFALAKARDDLHDYPAAAGILREANGMVRAAQPWNRAAWQAQVAERMAEQADAARDTSTPAFVPVFVLGVPRSGTTLTATLLARATEARDRGELRTLRFIGEQLAAGGHMDNPAAIAEAATLYRTLAVQDDAPARFYIDQDPLNFRWLHVVAAMFPQARVVHLRRDPRDTALSLWSQDFAHPDLGFACDFDDIAAFMAGHHVLMEHWKHDLALPVFELDYEALVADSDTTLAALRNFIGVPAREPGGTDKDAPVQSASVWQARQPVYSISVGRWRHYAPQVPELERFATRAD